MQSIKQEFDHHFGVGSIIDHFENGLFMIFGYCEILVETDENLSMVQVIIGVPEKFCSECDNESLKKECEELLWQIFYDIISVKVVEHNKNLPLTKKILSLDGMKKGQHLFYLFEDVMKCHDCNRKIIHHSVSHDGVRIADNIGSLLISWERKVSDTFNSITLLLHHIYFQAFSSLTFLGRVTGPVCIQ